MNAKNAKKILMLSRKYPPSVGGMQVYARDFIEHMGGIYDVDKVVLGKGQGHLVWFLPYLFMSSFALNMTRDYDLVWLCDALLAPLGVALKKAFNVKVGVTVHGLDMTYDRFLYQSVVPGAVSRLDRVVCVSGNTREECLKRGVDGDRLSVIPNGIRPEGFKWEFSETEGKELLREAAGGDLGEKKVLLTVGRLIKRKGVDWFIENVMPRLEDDFVYLIAGAGPEYDNIAGTIKRCGLSGRVKLLGRVSDDLLKALYRFSYAMVLPNQRIERDPEGFGIVAIEAASCGLPVIANLVDGIGEAVLDGRTGWLVDYNDADLFIEKIKRSVLERSIVEKGSEAFYWPNIAGRYQKEIDAI